MSSCQKDALVIPQSGNPARLDTVIVDLSKTFFWGNRILVTCGQTLILDAGKSNAEYLWRPTGDTTQRILIPGVPDSSFTIYTVFITADTSFEYSIIVD